jgi:outer membrane immunogenic protein
MKLIKQEKSMSFRSALLASAAILVAGSAFAADLPARVAAPAPYIAAPIFTWTGFYVGLNAGAGFNKSSGHNYYGYAVDPTNFYGFNNNSSNNAGFTGGAQAGYNMQFGSFVAGVETDINYIDRNKGFTGIVPTGLADGTYYAVSRGKDNNYFGTVRGRLGYAFDRALIYVTGGLAYGGNSGSGAVYRYNSLGGVPGVGTAVSYTGGNSSSIGWTLGAGLEYAFSNAWSVKAEYLHVDLGSNSRTFVTSGVGVTPVTGTVLRSENRFDVVRAGLNYRF